ncbi:hypothetical protein [Pseudomonas aeruginosa]|uniref:hypothetical protein n=1 Tax=Pseudomonas aeruginosa TaxID=287 RepID=UPI0018B0D423|nr:hypothetical protein [Pseudomonas aeruginosa]
MNKALVEQAGGDERAAFEVWATHLPMDRQPLRPDLYMPQTQWAWEAWQFRAALAQPSPVRSSLLINGYQLRAALDFIAPDGTAEQLESEACIEWRQQNADFLEAGLYAFCAEYPEEGGVLLDEEPTTAQPSPLQSEQAEAERPEVVAVVRAKGFGRVCEAIDADTLYQHCSEGEPLMTVTQHSRIVGALRFERQQMDRAFTACINERDAALARVAELERQEPVAHLRESDLERLNKPGIAGSAGSLWNGPREGFVPVYTAPVAQAQHSVPAAWYYDAPSQAEAAIIDIRGMWGEDDCPTYEDVASALRRLLAAAPGKEDV